MKAVRVIEFDAAHRVHGHESKCASLHGHRYKLEAHAEAEKLDSVGRVVDFSVIKNQLGGWIDRYWDHTTLVWDQDMTTVKALESMPKFKEAFVCSFNPTAENMAQWLIDNICPILFLNSGVSITKIVLWETPNCFVEVERTIK
jgi:6-pyruvoyltetrahydropterin/6-carboxytetrahydropterin synthase